MDTVASHPKFGGGCVFRLALRREQLLAALVSSVDWVARGTNRTAWAVSPRCSTAYGRRVAVGPQTGERSWELLPLHLCWRLGVPRRMCRRART